MKNFTRTIEDFVCEKCGKSVKGDGYTNHCPKCLWSKHVDIIPGDRESNCGGMMEPTSVQKEGKDFFINQKCLKCGHERRQKIHKDDDFEKVVLISTNQIK